MNIDKQIRQWAQMINESEIDVSKSVVSEDIPQQRKRNGDFMTNLWIQAFKDKFCICTGVPKALSDDKRIGVIADWGNGKFNVIKLPLSNNSNNELFIQCILVFDTKEEAYKYIRNNFKIIRDQYKDIVLIDDMYDAKDLEFYLDEAIQKIGSISFEE